MLTQFFDSLQTIEQEDPSSRPSSRARREFVPTDKKDQEYWIRRLKNNSSAQRSRSKLKIQRTIMEYKLRRLNDQNYELRSEIARLQHNYNAVRMQMMHLNKVNVEVESPVMHNGSTFNVPFLQNQQFNSANCHFLYNGNAYMKHTQGSSKGMDFIFSTDKMVKQSQHYVPQRSAVLMRDNELQIREEMPMIKESIDKEGETTSNSSDAIKDKIVSCNMDKDDGYTFADTGATNSCNKTSNDSRYSQFVEGRNFSDEDIDVCTVTCEENMATDTGEFSSLERTVVPIVTGPNAEDVINDKTDGDYAIDYMLTTESLEENSQSYKNDKQEIQTDINSNEVVKLSDHGFFLNSSQSDDDRMCLHKTYINKMPHKVRLKLKLKAQSL